MIKTKRLTKSYCKHTAVNHVYMLVNTDAIYGLIGENGAGKTTILRIIGNLTKPSSEEIYLSGEKDQFFTREVPCWYPYRTTRNHFSSCRLSSIRDS